MDWVVVSMTCRWSWRRLKFVAETKVVEWCRVEMAGMLARSGLEVMPDRSARSLVGFVEAAVKPGAQIVSDAWPAYNTLTEKGSACAGCDGGNPDMTGNLSTDCPSGVRQSEKLVARLSSRRFPAAFAGVSQRVHLPVQQAVLPVQFRSDNSLALEAGLPATYEVCILVSGSIPGAPLPAAMVV